MGHEQKNRKEASALHSELEKQRADPLLTLPVEEHVILLLFRYYVQMGDWTTINLEPTWAWTLHNHK